MIESKTYIFSGLKEFTVETNLRNKLKEIRDSKPKRKANIPDLNEYQEADNSEWINVWMNELKDFE